MVRTELIQNRHLSTKLHGVTPQEIIFLIWVTLVIFVTDYVVCIPVAYVIFCCWRMPAAFIAVVLFKENVLRRLSWHHLHYFCKLEVVHNIKCKNNIIDILCVLGTNKFYAFSLLSLIDTFTNTIKS